MHSTKILVNSRFCCIFQIFRLEMLLLFCLSIDNILTVLLFIFTIFCHREGAFQLKTESLKLQAYTILKDRITNCIYAPGCQLNEEILQKELEMSRTPIRDALGRLEQEGLVNIRSKKGITITKLSLNQLNMVFELRQLLECHALTQYGNLLSDEQLNTFYQRFSKNDFLNEQAYYHCDDAFHGMIMSVVPNIYIAQSYQQIINQNTRFRILTGHRTEQRLLETNQEHLNILLACMQRNWSQAADAMRHHLTCSKSAAFQLLLEQPEMLE